MWNEVAQDDKIAQALNTSFFNAFTRWIIAPEECLHTSNELKKFDQNYVSMNSDIF